MVKSYFCKLFRILPISNDESSEMCRLRHVKYVKLLYFFRKQIKNKFAIREKNYFSKTSKIQKLSNHLLIEKQIDE